MKILLPARTLLSPDISRRIGTICALAATTVVSSATTVIAQQISDFSGLDSSLFNQDLTDAATQGFRQRDRVFFEEGGVQFEQVIKDLQEGKRSEPILRIEPVANDWQQFETPSETD